MAELEISHIIYNTGYTHRIQALFRAFFSKQCVKDDYNEVCDELNFDQIEQDIIKTLMSEETNQSSRGLDTCQLEDAMYSYRPMLKAVFQSGTYDALHADPPKPGADGTKFYDLAGRPVEINSDIKSILTSDKDLPYYGVFITTCDHTTAHMDMKQLDFCGMFGLESSKVYKLDDGIVALYLTFDSESG